MASKVSDAAMEGGDGPAAVKRRRELEKVRVEDDASMGRSYSKRASREKGLGESRKAWTYKSFDPKSLTVDSLTYFPHCHLERTNRALTLEYFHNTWDLTETLFTGLKDDATFYAFPDQLRRPLIFYFGHVAAVYINKLNLAGLVDNVNVLYQKIFETGVDEMSWDDMDDMQDVDYPWPDIKQTVAFRNKCKAVIEECIAAMPEPAPGKPLGMHLPHWSVHMGFEHERIHLETSSVLIHQLPVASVTKPALWRYAPSNADVPDKAPANKLVDIEAGTAKMGKPDDFPSYGWDNEYGRRDVEVPAFQASQFLVTNAEFLPFVLAGGYETKKWWVSPTGDDEGWRWLQYRGVKHPLWWVATKNAAMDRFRGHREGAHVGHMCELDDGCEEAGDGEAFMYRAMFDIIAMPWDWPVEVNYNEARAFLNWKGEQDGKAYRVPTEAEYHRMRAEPSVFDADRSEEGWEGKVDPIMRSEVPGNLNMRYGSSSPVDMFEPSAAGIYDTHGNVWEWIEDHFAPLPDFKIHYLYDDFSSPCFDGWHTMMAGGCWVSTGDEASNFARFAFRRHFFQHLGFRYVTNEAVATEPYPGAATVANLWEGMGSLSIDMDTAFSRPKELVPFAPDVVSVPLASEYASKLRDALAAAYGAHGPGAASGGAGGAGASTAVSGGAGAGAGSPVVSDFADAKVLHLGCGVGGVTFELARSFGAVVGVDNVEPLIRHARLMVHHGEKLYERVHEGVLATSTLAKVPEGIRRGRASFWLSDAAALSDDVKADAPYTMVVADGIVERLTQPLNLLTTIHEVLAPGGLLVVSSSNDWRADVTPRTSWLGGFQMNGEDMDTITMLTHVLKKRFELVGSSDVARLKRLHARKYDLSVMQVSVWKLKA